MYELLEIATTRGPTSFDEEMNDQPPSRFRPSRYAAFGRISRWPHGLEELERFDPGRPLSVSGQPTTELAEHSICRIRYLKTAIDIDHAVCALRMEPDHGTTSGLFDVETRLGAISGLGSRPDRHLTREVETPSTPEAFQEYLALRLLLSRRPKVHYRAPPATREVRTRRLTSIG